MTATVRNTLAVVGGFVALAAAKYAAILLGNAAIAPPTGVDLSTIEGFTAAAFLAVSHRMKLALGIGALHMVGGIAAAVMLPFPVWVVAVDLVAMYLPMAWVGGRLVIK